MSLLNVSNLEKSFGSDLLFEHVSFEIQNNDRIGLVGVNGSGKTTLFKLLTQEMSSDGGDIFLSKDTRIGYMEQHVCRDSDISAYAEVLSVFSSLLDMEQELEYLNQQLQSASDKLSDLIEQHAALNDAFLHKGGLTFRGRTRSTLLGLGFSDEQIAMPVMSLSGGQKAKLQLAKLLLSEANLLLLDEPTNHLDIQSCEALESALQSYEGTLLIISHDRYFINKMADKIYALTPNGIEQYIGNYDTYLEHQKAQQQEQEIITPKVNDYKLRKERESEIRKKRTALKRTEEKIEQLEQEIAKLEQALLQPEIASDYQAAVEITEQMNAFKEESEQLLVTWSELSEELEQQT